MVDVDLQFTYMEVGAEGKCSKAAIYNDSDLFDGLEQNTLKKPADDPLEGNDIDTII